MRALRIELRRSGAAGIALLFVALGFWSWVSGMGPTPAGWATMAFSQRSGLLLTFPLTVGAGAWQARRENLGAVRELFATSPRTPAQRLAPVAAALAIAVVFAYSFTLLWGTARVWRSPADAYLTLEGGAAAAIGMLSLVSAAWMGLSLGRLIPSAFTAPVVTMLGVAAVVVLDELDGHLSGPAYGLLMPALEIPYQRDAAQIPLQVSSQQGLWLAALAITAFAAGTAVSRRGKLLALAPVAVAALIVIPTLPDGDTDSVYADDKDAVRPVCTQESPTVCVMRVHSGVLDEVTGPARKALHSMAFLPEAPTSVREVPTPAPGSDDSEPAVRTSPDQTVPAQTLPLTVYLTDSGHVEDSRSLLGQLIEAAGAPDCPASQWKSDQELKYYVARELAGAWLSRKAGVVMQTSDYPELFDPAWKAFTALPAETQQERVVEFRDNALHCRGDLYATLIGTAAKGSVQG